MRRAYFPVIVFTIPRFHENIIVVVLLARARLWRRIPWINQRAPDTGLPAGEKLGCQACSRVRELRDAGSAVDLSRERVRRWRVQPDVRSFLSDPRGSRTNVTSSLDGYYLPSLTFK